MAKLNIASGSSNTNEGSQERITLIVDGSRFSIETCKLLLNKLVETTTNRLNFILALLIQHPNSLLGRMFSSGIEWQVPNERGEFEVADGLSSTVFRAILDFYRCGHIKCPSGVSVQELREACDYLMVLI